MIVEYRIVVFDEEIVCIRDDYEDGERVYAEGIYSGLVDPEDQAAVKELFECCMLQAEADYGSVLPWVMPPDIGVPFMESEWLARSTQLVRP